jgi:hypothetical protein
MLQREENNMEKNQRNLKHLAEAYVYSHKKLTRLEFEALKNSKYSVVLREKEYKSSFDTIREHVALGEAETKKAPKKEKFFGHSRHVNVNTSRHYIKELIDDLEEHFGIGVENQNPYKSRDVDIHELKDLIKYYVIQHGDKHSETFRRVKEAANDARSSADLIMHLHSLAV